MIRFVLLLPCLVFAGCLTAVGPDYVPPELEAPETWSDGRGDDPPPAAQWWSAFGDPTLDELMAEAEAGNLDLLVAVARIDESRAALGVASGQYLPNLGVGASAALVRQSQEVTGRSSKTDTSFNVGPDMSWEIDLFGRIRRSVESATADLDATIEDYGAVLIALHAEIASAYVELRTIQGRIRIAESNAAAQRKSRDIVMVRRDLDDVSGLDEAQADSNVASTEATIPQLKAAAVRQLNRLSTLTGQWPGALTERLAQDAKIPEPPARILTGIPADILRRRPDVRGAERTLAAQTARIGVATAELYPQLTLFGTVGLEALRVDDLFKGSAHSFSVGPSLSWNLFNGARLRRQINVEEFRAEQALANWRNSVLVALEEVETALADVKYERERREALSRAADAYRRTVGFARDQYREGEIAFQQLLDAERNLLTFEDSEIASRGQVAQNVIRLYRALGGDWVAVRVEEVEVEQ